MTKRELVSSYEIFYHATPISNIQLIEVEGLKGTKYQPNDFSDPKKAREQICFTTLPHLQSQISAMRDRYESEVVVYFISANILASKKFGLDYTHSGIHLIERKHTVEALRQMINTYGTIACFEDIPRANIELMPN